MNTNIFWIYKIPHLLLHLVKGYNILISNNRTTCQFTQEGNKIRRESTNLEACRDMCDKDDECNFFFINSKQKCVTYRQCDEDKRERRGGEPGTTYEKIKGNQTKPTCPQI